MDERVFGELTKRVAAAPSRRGMLRALTGGIGAAVVAMRGRPVPAGAQEVGEDLGEEVLCRPRKFPCRDKLQCCARKCIPGTIQGQPAMVCGCNKKGTDCIHGLGTACCSGKCAKSGKCK